MGSSETLPKKLTFADPVFITSGTFIYLFIYLFIHIFIHLFIYLLNFLCYDSKEDTLPMALFVSSLPDGDELSFMNGQNNSSGINLPQRSYLSPM